MGNFVNMRKKILDAQKLSGRQCRRADEVFGTLAHSGVAKKGDKAKEAAAKGAGTSGPIKTPVKLSDEISIIPTKKGGEKKVSADDCQILTLTFLNCF